MKNAKERNLFDESSEVTRRGAQDEKKGIFSLPSSAELRLNVQVIYIGGLPQTPEHALILARASLSFCKKRKFNRFSFLIHLTKIEQFAGLLIEILRLLPILHEKVNFVEFL